MVLHNRLICHHWRANVDMQPILDRHAAVAYMVKYATKGEKASSNLKEDSIWYRSIVAFMNTNFLHFIFDC